MTKWGPQILYWYTLNCKMSLIKQCLVEMRESLHSYIASDPRLLVYHNVSIRGTWSLRWKTGRPTMPHGSGGTYGCAKEFIPPELRKSGRCLIASIREGASNRDFTVFDAMQPFLHFHQTLFDQGNLFLKLLVQYINYLKLFIVRWKRMQYAWNVENNLLENISSDSKLQNLLGSPQLVYNINVLVS